METILSAVYFLTGILFIAAHYYGSRLQALILKAFIIPFLIIILITNRSASWRTDDTLMLMGLIFSWAGDIMMTTKSSAFFKGGIAFFLLTHIMYIIVFIRGGSNFILEKPVLLILLISYEVILTGYLYNHLHGMKIPVIVYSAVIIAMLAAALNRYDAVLSKSYIMVLWGAIFFVISDSVLAVNRFRRPFRLHQLFVMLTYIAAQYLIISGYLIQFSSF